MGARSYRDLHVWRKSVALAAESYRVAKLLPASEAYGMARQIRRAAASIPANVAEGFGRLHRGDCVRHLSIARGSLMELRSHFDVAASLGLLSRSDVRRAREISDHTGRMLTKLIRRLQN
jgi:four helix bundle protein